MKNAAQQRDLFVNLQQNAIHINKKLNLKIYENTYNITDIDLLRKLEKCSIADPSVARFTPKSKKNQLEKYYQHLKFVVYPCNRDLPIAEIVKKKTA